MKRPGGSPSRIAFPWNRSRRSEDTGEIPFSLMGQQTLFQRLYAEYGVHDFAAGFCAAGPNAFVQCESHMPFSFSGAMDSWASGLLFDIVNVDGGNLSFTNRGQDNHGAGWCAANSMMWQCSALQNGVLAPPGAWNWAYGAWAQFAGNGIWVEPNKQRLSRSSTMPNWQTGWESP
ncbi:MAG: hypothetical protein MZV63_58075 [Marinilabiliales bacterium]|nr:hypothetical protein [Marinilabiliales bacterium]